MKGGPQPRVSSPVLRRSTLITSAPRSASTWPAHGPARMRASSSTRRPDSGPGIEDPLLTLQAYDRPSLWRAAEILSIRRERYCVESVLERGLDLSTDRKRDCDEYVFFWRVAADHFGAGAGVGRAHPRPARGGGTLGKPRRHVRGAGIGARRGIWHRARPRHPVQIR